MITIEFTREHVLLYAGRQLPRRLYIVVDVNSALARFKRPPSTPSRASNDAEYVAWFRFAVTWTYLERPPGSPLPPDRVTLITTTASSKSGSQIPSPQWEMVVPKMVRPVAKSDHSALTPAPPLAMNQAQAFDALPRISYTSAFKFLLCYWPSIALAILGIAAVSFLLLQRPGTGESAARERSVETAGIGAWSRQPILPPGRWMSVYEPSRKEPDFRIEFQWVPDTKGVGWVFRTRSAGDYYASRLTLVQPGARLILAVEHFIVLGGVQSAHSRKVMPLANKSRLVRVRMDAIGPAFTLSLQENIVDTWADARLGSGTAGFYDERGQRPEVQALRFTFINKGASRTALTSLP